MRGIKQRGVAGWERRKKAWEKIKDTEVKVLPKGETLSIGVSSGGCCNHVDTSDSCDVSLPVNLQLCSGLHPWL